MGSLDRLAKVNDICLFVRDFKGSVKFYTEKFGLRVKRLQPDSEHANYAEFDFNGTSVTLWDESGVREILDRACLGGEGHHFMIAVKVPSVEDVDAIHGELTGRGVVCVSCPKIYPFGSKAAYYLDHERNIWEIFAWMEGNGPGLL
ncbi:MAG: VOC family protein [Synergistaceae bacterium]|jgi:catechol 2,3-dioxygenase-like lactoylglutathione lyase family enzyme|nr:VOC family protein [Synergistaceae bacterium]